VDERSRVSVVASRGGAAIGEGGGAARGGVRRLGRGGAARGGGGGGAWRAFVAPLMDWRQFYYHQQPKELKSSDRLGPQQPLQLKKLSQKANWRSFWPGSTFWQYFRSASRELLSELPCFAPPTTATSAHLSPCSYALVANKSKDTGRCYFLM
jgi:hypothetical protein